MFLNANLFKGSIELANNGLFDEFEFEDNGILMRAMSCRQYDGSGNLRVDGNMKPTNPRLLFLGRLSPPFRLRPTSLYEFRLGLKFSALLPNGIKGVIEVSNRAVDAGLMITPKRLDGSEDGLIRATMFSLRTLEIDAMYPIAVLRFVKVNTTPKKKEDSGEN